MKDFIISSISNYIDARRQDIAIKLFLWIIVFTAVYFFIKFAVKNIKAKIEGEGLTKDIYAKRNAKLVGSILFITLMIFNVLAVFQIIWFDSAIIMWGLSLSIWFAMETTIGNLISGVFILTNKKIKLGDFIELLGKLNMRWTVEEINVRYTVIRSFDKRRTVIPNSIVAKTPIKTIKSEPILKGEIEFIIPRKTPLEIVKKIYQQVINTNKEILYPEEANLVIKNFTTAWITLQGFFFVNPAKRIPFLVGRDLKRDVLEKLRNIGIKLPYPHKTIWVES
jgi:small-conductance mechanosensitive channel